MVMVRCQPPRKVAIPRCWLMTDARLGPDIARIIAHMPPRSAVVLRPHALGFWGTASWLRQFRRIARAKRHVLLSCGPVSEADDGTHVNRHNRTARTHGFCSVAVHNRREADFARRRRADCLLVSPIWPTASHPGGVALGMRALRQFAARARCPVIALGGVTRGNQHLVRRHGAHGWAAIGAWREKSR